MIYHILSLLNQILWDDFTFLIFKFNIHFEENMMFLVLKIYIIANFGHSWTYQVIKGDYKGHMPNGPLCPYAVHVSDLNVFVIIGKAEL